MKKPWLACVLNIILPGVGYVYVGHRVAFGILLFISNLFIWSFSWPSGWSWSKLSNSMLASIFIAVILTTIAFAYDAYKDAQEVNLRSGEKAI